MQTLCLALWRARAAEPASEPSGQLMHCPGVRAPGSRDESRSRPLESAGWAAVAGAHRPSGSAPLPPPRSRARGPTAAGFHDNWISLAREMPGACPAGFPPGWPQRPGPRPPFLAHPALTSSTARRRPRSRAAPTPPLEQSAWRCASCRPPTDEAGPAGGRSLWGGAGAEKRRSGRCSSCRPPNGRGPGPKGARTPG